jgi:aspartyl-tRNA(Asn)/glutamyl-tRNA(Gln) amidotransferase subunit A
MVICSSTTGATVVSYDRAVSSEDAAELSLIEILECLEEGSLRAVDLVEACISRIKEREPAVRAFVTTTYDSARVAAAQADERRARRAGVALLAGVPIAVKDVLPVRGVPTTSGSRTPSRPAPRRSAKAWRRLERAGASLLGKTTTHEFGYGTTSGPTTNPWSRRHSPGGSSGGSAAALAARMVPAAVGTDTAGSLRIPAAACGVSAFRSASGRIPLTGTMPLSHSFEIVGPMARRVRDVALLVRVMAGEGKPVYNCLAGLSGAKIGLPVAMSWNDEDDQILDVCNDAVDVLNELGADIVKVEGPPMPEMFGGGVQYIFDVIHQYEAFGIFERRLKSFEMGEEVKRRFKMGKEVSREEYELALKIRHEWGAAWREEMIRTDITALAFPTVRQPPPEDLDVGMSISCSVPWTLLGFGVLNVPVGRDGRGLPVGLSVAGLPECEDDVFRCGIALDESIGFWKVSPRGMRVAYR